MPLVYFLGPVGESLRTLTAVWSNIEYHRRQSPQRALLLGRGFGEKLRHGVGAERSGLKGDVCAEMRMPLAGIFRSKRPGFRRRTTVVCYSAVGKIPLPNHFA